MGIVRSSFCVEGDAFSGAWVKYTEDADVDVATGTEESSQDGVTGLTVNIPSSCSAAGDEEIPAGASDEAPGVEGKECAIGPAEQVHAKTRRIEKRAKSISAVGLSLELSNEREDDRQENTRAKEKKTVGQTEI